jgi:hypothetical protein
MSLIVLVTLLYGSVLILVKKPGRAASLQVISGRRAICRLAQAH